MVVEGISFASVTITKIIFLTYFLNSSYLLYHILSFFYNISFISSIKSKILIFIYHFVAANFSKIIYALFRTPFLASHIALILIIDLIHHVQLIPSTRFTFLTIYVEDPIFLCFFLVIDGVIYCFFLFLFAPYQTGTVSYRNDMK